MEALETAMEAIVFDPAFAGGALQREADRRNVVIDAVALLRDDGCYRMRLLELVRASHPDLDITRWLRVVAFRALMRYLDGTRTAEIGGPSGPAEALLRRAARTLREPDLSALELWTHGAAPAEIARELDLRGGPDEAQRRIADALTRLQEVGGDG